MTQKQIFLDSEGDAWYARNSKAMDMRALPQGDPLLSEVLKLHEPRPTRGSKVLEIGCGDARRIAWLAANHSCECVGIEPSRRAVDVGVSRGIEVHRGTADCLPFQNAAFDIVLFGFCLYLCDREDLFRIASEADRVLRCPGWLLIQDFHSDCPRKREYRHRPGVFTHKMDYSSLFTWHPFYRLYSQRIVHHSSGEYTDDAEEWVGISVIRKQQY